MRNAPQRKRIADLVAADNGNFSPGPQSADGGDSRRTALCSMMNHNSQWNNYRAESDSARVIDSEIAKVTWLLYNAPFVLPHSSARSLVHATGSRTIEARAKGCRRSLRHQPETQHKAVSSYVLSRPIAGDKNFWPAPHLFMPRFGVQTAG